MSYRAVASTGRLSDGEEGYLPVLSRRMMITESLPLPIRGKQTKQFEFRRLLDSGESDTIRHQSLTVQMASNPAWYAVLSLPYLMEYPHQCSEQIFNRLYANSLAHRIATSDPKIERVFEQWRGTDALVYGKNQRAQAVLLRSRGTASSARKSRRQWELLVAIEGRTVSGVEGRPGQLPDGRWSWFPDGPASTISRFTSPPVLDACGIWGSRSTPLWPFVL